jgi:type VI secretion system protein ImpB
MAKDDPSIAPNEMVNIRLPSPEPGAEGEELPLRMAVIGDFTGKQDDTPVAERKLRNIDSKNFDSIMASMDVTLEYSVPNKISGIEGEEIPVELKVDKMKSFRPEEVARQVPQVRELMELRNRLVDLQGRITRDPSVGKELNEILQMFNKELGLDEPKEK